MKAKAIGYWVATLLLTLELLVSAEWDLAHRPYVVELVTHLGYPVYLLTILGVWKFLAGITLLVPRFARLKEWAYAGVFFAMTGAAISHAVRGDDLSHLIAPLSFAALNFISWILRPPSRTLSPNVPANVTA